MASSHFFPFSDSHSDCLWIPWHKSGGSVPQEPHSTSQSLCAEVRRSSPRLLHGPAASVSPRIDWLSQPTEVRCSQGGKMASLDTFSPLWKLLKWLLKSRHSSSQHTRTDFRISLPTFKATSACSYKRLWFALCGGFCLPIFARLSLHVQMWQLSALLLLFLWVTCRSLLICRWYRCIVGMDSIHCEFQQLNISEPDWCTVIKKNGTHISKMYLYDDNSNIYVLYLKKYVKK